MKARVGLSIVMWFLVLGAFSACQETSKHKSQSTGSSQVSASSGVPSQGSLSANRTSSTNKAAQSNQAQLQQPHSDSYISASEANSTISTSSSPDTDLSPKPKAITKKQAHDFCHSDWVKQHYPCKKGEACHYTQEKVTVYDAYDAADPYQCKILSPEQNLAVILKVVNTIYNDSTDDGTYEETYYTAIIDLVDTKTLRILDRFKGGKNYIPNGFFDGVYIRFLSNELTKKDRLFGVIFNLTVPDKGGTLMRGNSINLYHYSKNGIKQVLYDLKLGEKSQYEDDDMERKIPKNTKKNCINIIENEKTDYHFVNTTNKELPDLVLNKTINKQWIQGRHLHDYPMRVIESSICDSHYPTKVIKRSKILKKTIRLKFSNGKYNVPEDWRSGFLDKIGVY